MDAATAGLPVLIYPSKSYTKRAVACCNKFFPAACRRMELQTPSASAIAKKSAMAICSDAVVSSESISKSSASVPLPITAIAFTIPNSSVSTSERLSLTSFIRCGESVRKLNTSTEDLLPNASSVSFTKKW